MKHHLKIPQLKRRWGLADDVSCLFERLAAFLLALCCNHLGSCLPGGFCLSCHGSLQVLWQSDVLLMIFLSCITFGLVQHTFISTLSTWTPQGSVATSKLWCMALNGMNKLQRNNVCINVCLTSPIVSLSERISERFLVPRMFLLLEKLA